MCQGFSFGSSYGAGGCMILDRTNFWSKFTYLNTIEIVVGFRSSFPPIYFLFTRLRLCWLVTIYDFQLSRLLSGATIFGETIFWSAKIYDAPLILVNKTRFMLLYLNL